MSDIGICDECGEPTLHSKATSYCGNGRWRVLSVCDSCGSSNEDIYTLVRNDSTDGIHNYETGDVE